MKKLYCTILLFFCLSFHLFAGGDDLICNGRDSYDGTTFSTTNLSVTIGWDNPTTNCDGSPLTNAFIYIWQGTDTNSFILISTTNDFSSPFYTFYIEDSQTLWLGFQSVDMANTNVYSGRRVVRLINVAGNKYSPNNIFIKK